MTGTAQTSGPFSNVTFAFTTGSSTQTFSTRCYGLNHGYDVVATESHARTARAFYPRQRALSQFSLTLQLKGYADYKAFMDFMRAYVTNFAQAASGSMTVSVPSRNFMRYGVPIDGIADGDHVGAILFQPVVVFEPVYDPLDTQLFTTTANASQVDLGKSQADEAATFFYPVTASTNNPNATGESLYDAPAIVSPLLPPPIPIPGRPGFISPD
jgi:hypothetical protein